MIPRLVIWPSFIIRINCNGNPPFCRVIPASLSNMFIWLFCRSIFILPFNPSIKPPLNVRPVNVPDVTFFASKLITLMSLKSASPPDNLLADNDLIDAPSITASSITVWPVICVNRPSIRFVPLASTLIELSTSPLLLRFLTAHEPASCLTCVRTASIGSATSSGAGCHLRSFVPS